MENRTASFEFLLKPRKDKDRPYRADNSAIIVLAENVAEAILQANDFLGKRLLDEFDLIINRIVDSRLLVQKTDVLERKMFVEERQLKADLNVKHSGELLEKRINVVA